MASISLKASNFIKSASLRGAYARWLTSTLLGRAPFVELPNGGRGYATRKFNDFYGIWVQRPGFAEFTSFRTLLGSGGVYVDVGANMGLTTVTAWKTGKATRIMAFEPTHRYAAAWHYNVEVNGVQNASLFQCAVGERCGISEFIVNTSSPMNNRLNLGAALARYDSPDRNELQQVPVLALDAVADHFGLDSIALLKVDVEGAEPLVLRGARDLLRKRRIAAVYMEFIPEYVIEMKEDLEGFVDFIFSCGYTPHRLSEFGRLGLPMTSAQLRARDFLGLNIVLLPAASSR